MQPGLLPQLHPGLAFLGRGYLHKHIRDGCIGLLVVARRGAGLVGGEPDLQEMHRVIQTKVLLAVGNACTSAYHLHFVGPNNGLVAKRIFVR